MTETEGSPSMGHSVGKESTGKEQESLPESPNGPSENSWKALRQEKNIIRFIAEYLKTNRQFQEILLLSH